MISKKTAMKLSAKYQASNNSRLHFFSQNGTIEDEKTGRKLLKEANFIFDIGGYGIYASDKKETRELNNLMSYIIANTPNFTYRH